MTTINSNLSFTQRHPYLTTDAKLVQADVTVKELEGMIQSLMTAIDFYRGYVHIHNDNVSKRGRMASLVKDNKAILSSLRDVMVESILPLCKFISKNDLQRFGEGTMSKVIIDKMRIGGDDNEQVQWWVVNHLLIEKLIMEHRSLAAQKMKTKYLKGKTHLLLFYMWEK